jgi:hypothetical protein
MSETPWDPSLSPVHDEYHRQTAGSYVAKSDQPSNQEKISIDSTTLGLAFLLGCPKRHPAITGHFRRGYFADG